MKLIDLFSGVGGLSQGFEWSGFEPVVAIDFWDDAIKTYNHNRKDKVGISMDVTKFNSELLPIALMDQQLETLYSHLFYRMRTLHLCFQRPLFGPEPAIRISQHGVK